MIDFDVCTNCGRPVFFDWKGCHHVNPDYNTDSSADFSKPACDDPDVAAEEA